jgi:hypothetical protein
VFNRMKERVAAEVVMHAAGIEIITFITGLRLRRRKTATQRLTENAITEYTILSRKKVLLGIRDQRRLMVETTNTVRSNPITRQFKVSMHTIYSGGSGRHTEEILEVEPQVPFITNGNEYTLGSNTDSTAIPLNRSNEYLCCHNLIFRLSGKTPWNKIAY